LLLTAENSDFRRAPSQSIFLTIPQFRTKPGKTFLDRAAVISFAVVLDRVVPLLGTLVDRAIREEGERRERLFHG
jgi:hypothetical protein